MAVAVKVVGVSRTEKKLLAIAKGVPKQMVDAMNKAAALVSSTAKTTVPVDTGALRASIHTKPVEVDGDNVTSGVYTSKEYAAFVEFGTGIRGQATNTNTEVNVSYKSDWAGQIAQPYLYPALRQNEDKINILISKAVQSAVKESI